MTTLSDHVRQVDAGELSIVHAELGPVDGLALIPLHGWPYDIHTYAEVAPMLAEAGYRVIVPTCVASAPLGLARSARGATANRQRWRSMWSR